MHAAQHAGVPVRGALGRQAPRQHEKLAFLRMRDGQLFRRGDQLGRHRRTTFVDLGQHLRAAVEQLLVHAHAARRRQEVARHVPRFQPLGNQPPVIGQYSGAKRRKTQRLQPQRDVDGLTRALRLRAPHAVRAADRKMLKLQPLIDGRGERNCGNHGLFFSWGNPSFWRKKGFPHTPFLRKPLGAFVFLRGFLRGEPLFQEKDGFPSRSPPEKAALGFMVYVGFCKTPLFGRKMGSAVLNRRMLPAGRLLVSCRTSGSLNRPLAALTSGARAPLLRKPLWLQVKLLFSKKRRFLPPCVVRYW